MNNFSVVTFKQVLQFGFDGHALEHAGVTAACVAYGDDANRRAQGAENDAYQLAECGNRAVSANFHPEHEPVRLYVPGYVGLANDVGTLKMPDSGAHITFGKQVLCPRDLGIER